MNLLRCIRDGLQNLKLTHLRPILHFHTPRKYQKTYIENLYRNGTLGWNRLNESAESFMLYKNVDLTDHGLRSNPSCFKTSRSIVTSIGVIVDLCVRVDKCYKWIWNTVWNFMIKVPIIKKPVHWFALLISGLVYIWQGPPSWKS